MQPTVRSVRSVPGLLLMVGVLLVASPGAAQEPAGASNVPAVSASATARQQEPPPQPEPRGRQQTPIKVTRFTLEGTKAFTPSQITAVLGTRVSSRFFWGRKRFFDRRTFDDDLKRIVRYYQDHGYRNARVTAVNAALNEQQDEVKLSVTVEEGEPRRVAQLDFLGFEVLRPSDLARLRRNIALEAGTVLNHNSIGAAHGMAMRALQDAGYPFPQVDVQETPVIGTPVIVTLTADPGDPANYGEIAVKGDERVDDDVVRRALAFKTGDKFSLAATTASENRLYDMQLFQLADVELVGQTVVNGRVPVNVAVTSNKLRQIRTSVGYGSEERLRGEAEWKHLNFLGGARTGTIHGKWSSLDRGLRTELIQPYIFTPRLSLRLSGQAWYAREPAFDLDTAGGRATFTYRLTERDVVTGTGGASSISAALIHERQDYVISDQALADPTIRTQLIALGLDPETGAGQGTLGGIDIDFTRSTVADLLQRDRGYTLSGHVERAGGFLPGDFQYTEFTAETRVYVPIGRLGVLAQRARMGTIDGFGNNETSVPFFKRYFLGGATSLRGWGRFEVAPLSTSGLPIGGHSMLEMSAEFRTPPLWKKVGAVVFADAGSVTTTAWRIGIKDLLYDAGVGVRYSTPIGSIRADLARQLTRLDGLVVDGEPEKRRWRFHISLGQAF
jgi:outer membrane protein assembly complex protein YaeT